MQLVDVLKANLSSASDNNFNEDNCLVIQISPVILLVFVAVLQTSLVLCVARCLQGRVNKNNFLEDKIRKSTKYTI